jgi:hypothetical protein
MTPKEISRIIEREIGGDWSATNLHGCDLKKCLIRPKKRKIYFAGGKLKEVWIVLEELPETGDGFKVFFDDESRKFGLAQHSTPFGYACHSHDTFMAAFESM